MIYRSLIVQPLDSDAEICVSGLMPRVNGDILRWARETAGLSLEEAAHRLGMTGPTRVERLEALEQGQREPTRPMLVKMAEKYRRPLLTFYLANPPRVSDRGQDFRTLPEEPPADQAAIVDALLRDVHARQGLVRAALEETEEDEVLPFVGSARMTAGTAGVDALVASIRETLGVPLEAFRAEPTAANAFKVLREGAERAGVLVLLKGNLGSFHTDIDVRVFRGFALADEVVPLVVINEKDSQAAWSFTLLHELAHVWLGQTGVSGYDSDREIEQFCDAVAARFLLDPAELAELQPHIAGHPEDLKAHIDDFANARNVSRKMVAYNLLRAGAISDAVYRQLTDIFDAEREGMAAPRGEPNYYVVRRHRVGPALLGLVGRMLQSGVLTTTEAGRVLGVKATNVARTLMEA